MADNDQLRNPLDMLYQIVNDLWPGEGVPAPAAAAAEEKSKPSSAAPEKKKTEAKPAEKKAPSAPPFEEFWRRADERVDWTGVLLSQKPTDDSLSPDEWAAFHERAERVLEGDISAYAEVLQIANPLSDLKPYATHVSVAAQDPDTAEVSFEALPCKVEEKRLLAGLALRCARDVLALLPIKAVSVHGTLPGGASLEVTYPYHSLRKVQFSFIDPVAYAEEMGCAFLPGKE
jgi:hypothetical protein